MTNTKKQNKCNQEKSTSGSKLGGWAILAVVLLAVLLLKLVPLSFAAPNGASIISNSSTIASSTVPGNRNDSGGTITTLVMSTTQQDTSWKAYIGNVSGSLTLDDAATYTIYNWQIASISGEVFASRASSITWSAINCSNQTHIDTEQSALSFASTEADSINKTFNSTNHTSFIVNTRNMTNCRSTATYVNDTAQPQNASAIFLEAALSDGTNFVYATVINLANHGYNDAFMDFQMIVPQSKATSVPTPYYFYIELG